MRSFCHRKVVLPKDQDIQTVGTAHRNPEAVGNLSAALLTLLLVWTFAYMLSGRNLWASILAHGLIDTFAVVVVFLGLATPD